MPISNGVWLRRLLRLNRFNDRSHGEGKDALLSVPLTETVRYESEIAVGSFLALAYALLSRVESVHEELVTRGAGGDAHTLSIEIRD